MHIDMNKLTGAEMMEAEKLSGQKILGNENVGTAGLYGIMHVWLKRENPKQKFDDTLQVTIGDLNDAFADELNLEG